MPGFKLVPYDDLTALEVDTLDYSFTKYKSILIFGSFTEYSII
jgi:hypothetical protein